ncbi:MAG: type II toxin-antitoxin system VapC family toxin [Thermomicrobiales bacterium]
MSYLIDSDWLIDYLIGRTAAGRMVDRLMPDGIAISIITYMEVIEGFRGGDDRSGSERGLQGFRQFLLGAPPVGISLALADRAADVRIELRRQKRHVHHRALDILIAATAIDRNLILVTRNARDYDDISGLKMLEGAKLSMGDGMS